MREPENSVTGAMKTELGDINFTITDKDHVYITETRGFLTLRGIEYHTGLHLNFVDGEWKCLKFTDFYLSRPKEIKEPSSYARFSILEILVKEWTDFIKKNGKLLMEAEIINLNNKVCCLEQEEQEIEERLKNVQEEKAVVEALIEKKEKDYQVLYVVVPFDYR